MGTPHRKRIGYVLGAIVTVIAIVIYTLSGPDPAKGTTLSPANQKTFDASVKVIDKYADTLGSSNNDTAKKNGKDIKDATSSLTKELPALPSEPLTSAISQILELNADLAEQTMLARLDVSDPVQVTTQTMLVSLKPFSAVVATPDNNKVSIAMLEMTKSNLEAANALAESQLQGNSGSGGAGRRGRSLTLPVQQTGGLGSRPWLVALGVGIVGTSLGIAGLVRANSADDRADAAAATTKQATATTKQATTTTKQATSLALSPRITELIAENAALQATATALQAQLAAALLGGGASQTQIAAALMAQLNTTLAALKTQLTALKSAALTATGQVLANLNAAIASTQTAITNTQNAINATQNTINAGAVPPEPPPEPPPVLPPPVLPPPVLPPAY